MNNMRFYAVVPNELDVADVIGPFSGEHAMQNASFAANEYTGKTDPNNRNSAYFALNEKGLGELKVAIESALRRK